MCASNETVCQCIINKLEEIKHFSFCDTNTWLAHLSRGRCGVWAGLQSESLRSARFGPGCYLYQRQSILNTLGVSNTYQQHHILNILVECVMIYCMKKKTLRNFVNMLVGLSSVKSLMYRNRNVSEQHCKEDLDGN